MKEEKSLNQVLDLQTPIKPLANQNKKKRKEKKEKKNLTIVLKFTSFSWLVIGSNRNEVHDSNNHNWHSFLITFSFMALKVEISSSQ